MGRKVGTNKRQPLYFPKKYEAEDRIVAVQLNDFIGGLPINTVVRTDDPMYHFVSMVYRGLGE